MIRRYSSCDLKMAAEVFRAAFAAEPWNEEWSLELAETRIKELMSAPQSIGYVFEENGVIQAVLCGRKLTYLHGVEYVIDEFCVDRNRQGKGTGTAFLAAIEAYLREHGIFRIFLQTGKDMPAYSFYLKNGFRELEGHVSFSKEIG